MIRSAFVSVLCIGCLGSTPAGAKCIAAGDFNALAQALSDASKPDATDTSIKLEQGTYLATGSLNSDDVHGTLAIRGGYLPDPGHTCDDKLRSGDAAKTALQLTSGSFALKNYDNASKQVILNGLTVDGGGSPSSTFLVASAWQKLANMRITNFGRVYIGRSDAGSQTTEITNVLVDHVYDSSTSCLGGGNGGWANCTGIALGGNTNVFVDHLSVDLQGLSKFFLDAGFYGGFKNVFIWNSIFWDSSNPQAIVASDHSYTNDGIVIGLNDVIVPNVYLSPADSVETDPNCPTCFYKSQDPLWANPAIGDYHLTGGNFSPAINSGSTLALSEPAHDIEGTVRPIGSAPDLGAYESPYDDYAGGNTFVVTRTADDENPGSLRWAIEQANKNFGSSLVTFNLPCPSTIALETTLPGIVRQIKVDGYTAAGATVNTDPFYFNAHLCVVLKPGTNPGANAAFNIADSAGSLDVRGLGFGQFPLGAIRLLNGTNHHIAGNQFGGPMNNGALQLYGFDHYALYLGMTGPVLIGGTDPADRNVFLNADSMGSANPATEIYVAGFTLNSTPVCQIINNLIGIFPDGTAQLNQEYGIEILGQGCLVQDNFLGNSKKDAIFVSGGSGNVIQRNTIGQPLMFDLGAGIRIANVGHDNVIGLDVASFGQAGFYGNSISYTNGGGVVVDSGVGNTIRGNNIVWTNGKNIDLGNDGTTANDSGDQDTGANNLQNFPVLHGLTWPKGVPQVGASYVDAAVSGVLNSNLGPGTYHIDLYYDTACNANRRGGGYWIGSLLAVSMPQGATSTSFIASPLTITAFDPSGVLSATATNVTDHSTSELGRCFSVDTIFVDDLDE